MVSNFFHKAVYKTAITLIKYGSNFPFSTPKNQLSKPTLNVTNSHNAFSTSNISSIFINQTPNYYCLSYFSLLWFSMSTLVLIFPSWLLLHGHFKVIVDQIRFCFCTTSGSPFATVAQTRSRKADSGEIGNKKMAHIFCILWVQPPHSCTLRFYWTIVQVFLKKSKQAAWSAAII